MRTKPNNCLKVKGCVRCIKQRTQPFTGLLHCRVAIEGPAQFLIASLRKYRRRIFSFPILHTSRLIVLSDSEQYNNARKIARNDSAIFCKSFYNGRMFYNSLFSLFSASIIFRISEISVNKSFRQKRKRRMFLVCFGLAKKFSQPLCIVTLSCFLQHQPNLVF